MFSLERISEISGVDLFTDKTVKVSSEGKKGMVTLFLSAKCPCSHSHVDEIKNLTKDFPEFSFVGVHSNTDEALDYSRVYFQKLDLPFPILEDKQASLADKMGALKTPHAFVFLADGSLVYKGGVSNSHDFLKADQKYLREALEAVQKAQKIKKSEGRTLGCVISRGAKNAW